MELFDSHAHYDNEKFNEDREELLSEIYNEGVTKILSAGYNIKSSKDALELANTHEYIYTTSGISPNDVGKTIEDTKIMLEQLEKIIQKDYDVLKKKKMKSKILGIGEIGLDYYWNKENKKVQEYAFVEQIKLANKLQLPIIIHTREAVMDTIKILKNNEVLKKGIFHCCPLNRELVKEALKLGFYISFAGPITFKNSKNSEEIIKMVPNDKILIETDSPYLSPEPLRGRRNDSRNVKHIAQKIAIVKNMELEKIAELTYKNTKKIYNID